MPSDNAIETTRQKQKARDCSLAFCSSKIFLSTERSWNTSKSELIIAMLWDFLAH